MLLRDKDPSVLANKPAVVLIIHKTNKCATMAIVPDCPRPCRLTQLRMDRENAEARVREMEDQLAEFQDEMRAETGDKTVTQRLDSQRSDFRFSRLKRVAGIGLSCAGPDGLPGAVDGGLSAEEEAGGGPQAEGAGAHRSKGSSEG